MLCLLPKGMEPANCRHSFIHLYLENTPSNFMSLYWQSQDLFSLLTITRDIRNFVYGGDVYMHLTVNIYVNRHSYIEIPVLEIKVEITTVTSTVAYLKVIHSLRKFFLWKQLSFPKWWAVMGKDTLESITGHKVAGKAHCSFVTDKPLRETNGVLVLRW